MNDFTYDIQELVEVSGVARRTIYFYVQQGVLPPPQGAGLAARYGEEHALRLKLIPRLRERGLRLDDIRTQFAQMDTAALRLELDRLEHEPETPLPAPAPETTAPARWIPAPAPYLRGGTWPAQRYLHYSLPAGMILAVPDNLSVQDEQRLQQLLHQAQQIFNGRWIISAGADSAMNIPASKTVAYQDESTEKPTGASSEAQQNHQED